MIRSWFLLQRCLFGFTLSLKFSASSRHVRPPKLLSQIGLNLTYWPQEPKGQIHEKRSSKEVQKLSTWNIKFTCGLITCDLAPVRCTIYSWLVLVSILSSLLSKFSLQEIREVKEANTQTLRFDWHSTVSLRNQPTFRDATTGLPAKWNLSNKRAVFIFATTKITMSLLLNLVNARLVINGR